METGNDYEGILNRVWGLNSCGPLSWGPVVDGGAERMEEVSGDLALGFPNLNYG